MRKIISIITALFMVFSTAICQATDIPLNDNLSPYNFAEAFNSQSSAEKISLNIVRDINTVKYDTEKNETTYFFVPVLDNSLYYHTIMAMQCNANNQIYQIAIFTDMGLDSRSMLKELGLYTLLVERTIGMPDGENHSDGMFAMENAIKYGKGSYWSSETQRRYIVLPNSASDGMGFVIYATR